MRDTWLLKLPWPPAAMPAGARLWRAREVALAYAYLDVPAPGAIHLVCTTDVPGAAAGADAPVHYIVETDVTPEAAADFDAWYETEHLPGLASVPGTVRARRFVDPSGSPRHYACYDLAGADVFGSPPWLAVRNTAWSARVRPNFRNTARTMFDRVSGV